ncbi:MAG: hypothetical protein U9Q79_12050, partial [Candidatus Hydrogenedentes bacterium]|nr:hypothetical protein [Candidatus Hydrogenedentota bacterium]
RVIVEGANMPVTYDGMRMLMQRGIEIIPDVYANAGGVIASNAEYRQTLGGIRFSKEMTFAHIRERFDAMYEDLTRIMKKGRTMTEATTDIALSRVYHTMLERGLLSR